MKNQFKNILWIIIAAGSLTLLVIALTLVGFKINSTLGSIQTSISSTITDIIDQSQKQWVATYIRDSAGLLISGLTISSITVLLTLTKLLLDLFKVNTKIAPKIWDYGFLVLIITSAVLTIAGSALYIDETVKRISTLSADGGVTSAMFILEIVPIPLALVPALMDVKIKKAKKKKK